MSVRGVQQSLTRSELIGSPRIIHSMRTVFLILMIALLPVRAWLGDAMAMQTVSGSEFTTKTIAISPEKIRAATTFTSNSDTLSPPCHDTAATVAHPSDLTTLPDLAAHGDCDQCSTCQVCHSVALSPVMHALPLLTLPTQVALSGQAFFASVPRAPHLKPPIS